MRLSQRLLESMGKNSDSSQKIVQFILDAAFAQKLKKGDKLYNLGKVEDKVCYVEKGLLKKYTIDAKGKEYINWFSMEGDFILLPKSFIRGEINEEVVEALEDCVIFSMRKGVLFKIMEYNNKICLTMVNELFGYLCVLQNICIFLRSLDASEKYTFLKSFNPKLVKRLNQKQLANFLGIDTTYLSKILKSLNE
ncbi:Crp/Fnr family transcriptional regulator [Aquirufa sp. ROCK2-A2]